ncbi:zinc-binding dehydrogenase [Natrinema versiforme]|uniref:Zinc-binding dehydrogenase n=1 Tax=Natrinema versiforme TaxID=88724 RepID=A0A4P8WNL9_9EURY|nr:alcohol dehydrogenase catalytic domain-containing protein [Natrinema versiforme]QCS44975.1 zinc-binding dehydrogenase [Natrinema versiforme]
MKAIIQTDERELSVQDVEQPTITNEQVLIEVTHAGLCGSDVHAYLQKGFDWVKMPRIMGHEYTGEVVETGTDVSNVEVGAQVVEKPIHTCGRCFQCQQGLENICQDTVKRGFETDGGFAEYVAVDADYVKEIPETIPSRHAAITEPLSVSTRAVYDRSSVKPGNTVLVQGPGPIGILCASLLDSMGTEVIATGLANDTKCRLPALELLGIETLNIESDSVRDYVDETTDGLGVDAVFDTTGHKSGLESATEYVRKGGEIIEVGIPSEPSEIETAPLVRGEINIKTSYSALWSNFEQSIRVLENASLDLDELITIYNIDSAENAFEDAHSGEVCKPVFVF